MFIDHRNGRHRTTWQQGDIAKFAHKHSSEYTPGEQYKTGLKIEKNKLIEFQSKMSSKKSIEKEDAITVILNEIIPFEAPVMIVSTYYHDTRLTQLPDIHRYIIGYDGNWYYVTEYDLK